MRIARSSFKFDNLSTAQPLHNPRGKKSASQSNIKSGAYASGGQTPKEGMSKINESGKGSGNR